MKVISYVGKRNRARYCGCNLGTFDTLEEAYKKYAEKKEEVIKQIAIKV